jgi:hypothetical protein
MPDDASRSRAWRDNPHPRYWWHQLPGHDYVPPIYSDLTDGEWDVLRDWYAETDRNGPIGGSSWGIAQREWSSSGRVPATPRCSSAGCCAG